MSDIKEYYVSSKNRTSGTSTSFVISIPEIQGYNKVRVKSVQIPLTYYIINSTNNKLDFTESGQSQTAATITPGNYTISSLTAAIKTAIEAVSPTASSYTVAYDSSTMKITMSSATSFALPFATGTNAATSICLILGFAASDIATSTSHTATNVHNLFGPLALVLKTTLITGYDNSPKTSDSADTGVLCIIPISVDIGSVLNYDADEENYVRMSNKTITPTFSITFPGNVSLDLNGSNVSMILQFSK
jgi:hypothetical protein